MALPRTWIELYERLAYVLGGDLPAAYEWVAQALEARWSVGDPRDLERGRRQIAMQRASGAVLLLEGEGEIAFCLDLRDRVRRAFARYFDGAVLDGPPWRVTPYEDRPAHAEWVAATDFDQVALP